MNFFTSKRFIIWVIAILVIINISALATIIIQKCCNIPCRAEKKYIFSEEFIHPDIHHFIKKRLNLNNEQVEKFKNFMREYRGKSRKLLDSLHEKRAEMLDELLSELDTQRLYKIADDIGLMHAELKKQTIQHFFQMLSICSAEQKEKLLKLFHDMDSIACCRMKDEKCFPHRPHSQKYRHKKKIEPTPTTQNLP